MATGTRNPKPEVMMPRKSKIPPVPELPKRPDGSDPGYDIVLVTPMVGGGATAGRVDVDHPIRATSIRGHLRHWWRLVCGYQLGEGMWRREEEIFGSTDFPSPVIVSVSAAPVEEADLVLPSQSGQAAYALFAAIENGSPVLPEGYGFHLSIQCATDGELNRRRAAQNKKREKARQPLLEETIEPTSADIEAALSAWIAYGGIGGRTRRGCGAVRCTNRSLSSPKLDARVFIGAAQSGALDAWFAALRVYRDFRQTPRGRVHRKELRPGRFGNVPGRSHWPEPDSIRKITGCSLRSPNGSEDTEEVPNDENTRDHSTPVVPDELLPAFPRAALGMPINFHFADSPRKQERADANQDPKDVQLVPVLRGRNGELKKAERMASPILTRPLWHGGKWVPAIIVLNISLPEGMQVRLEGKGASQRGNVSHDMTLDRVINPRLGRLRPMREQASAIEALVSYLTDNRFEELPR